MKAILRTIELWVSESDDRVKLLIIFVWAGFGVFVLISTLIAAWIMLPPGFMLF
jgi:polyferredoxin